MLYGREEMGKFNHDQYNDDFNCSKVSAVIRIAFQPHFSALTHPF